MLIIGECRIDEMAICLVNIAICLSVFLVVMSSLLNINVWISRITLAIREQDIKWEQTYYRLSFFWALLVLSILVRISL